MRQAEIIRNTKETKIQIKLDIDGKGESKIDTKCGFLDHMLTLFAKHGRFNLEVICDGDVEIDYHHTVEDVGIALGQAFEKATGDKKGIVRYGNMILPMDEALILSAVDISGRSYLNYDVFPTSEKCGDFDTELIEEFFLGFTRNFKITLHISQMEGRNSHHILEGSFKSVARSLRQALSIDEEFKDDLPSTKGVL